MLSQEPFFFSSNTSSIEKSKHKHLNLHAAKCNLEIACTQSILIMDFNNYIKASLKEQIL